MTPELECPDCHQQGIAIETGETSVAEELLKQMKEQEEQEEHKPKGHWMPYEPDKRGYTNEFTCSRCERVISSDHYCKMIDFDFCLYCGAHMDNAEGW